MKPSKIRIYHPSREEMKMVRDLTRTRRSLSERLKAGEVEIVDELDWTDVAQIWIPPKLYGRLKRASKRLNATPNDLAAKWITAGLDDSRKKVKHTSAHNRTDCR